MHALAYANRHTLTECKECSRPCVKGITRFHHVNLDTWEFVDSDHNAETGREWERKCWTCLGPVEDRIGNECRACAARYID